jgi:hypothetical protein
MISARIIPFTEDEAEIDLIRRGTVTYQGNPIPFTVETEHTKYMRENWDKTEGYYVDLIHTIEPDGMPTGQSGHGWVYKSSGQDDTPLMYREIRRRRSQNTRVQKTYAKRKSLR